jgi:hypothetical protein
MSNDLREKARNMAEERAAQSTWDAVGERHVANRTYEYCEAMAVALEWAAERLSVGQAMFTGDSAVALLTAEVARLRESE